MAPKKYKGQPVIVLGMGRSGTSVAAGLLQRAGVSIYRDSVPPNLINPRGFSEERLIVEFHQKLKKSVYSRFEGDPDFDHALVDEIRPLSLTRELADEAGAILRALEQPGYWGWKDPRTVLFLDLWLNLIPHAKLVIPLRHPVELMASYLSRIPDRRLLKRPDQVFRSYVAYHGKIAEAVARRQQQCFVFYAQSAYARPRQLWAELRGFLGEGLAMPEWENWFNAAEFTDLQLGPHEHRLFAKLFPESAEVFDSLNSTAHFAFPPDGSNERRKPVELLSALADLEEVRASSADWVPLLLRVMAPSVRSYSDYAEQTFGAMLGSLDEMLAGRSWLEQQNLRLEQTMDEQKAYIEALSAQRVSE